MVESEGVYTYSELAGCLDEALHEVQVKLAVLTKKYGAAFTSLRSYLDVNEPHLVESLDLLAEEIDSDILGKAADGSAAPGECAAWLHGIRDWKHLLFEAISRYEDFQRLAWVA